MTGDHLTWPGLTKSLLAGQDLTTDETRWAMARVMTGEAGPVPLAGFLVALRAKGETVDELSGLVEEMLAHARRIEVPGRCLDIVGTGGDMHGTVNISTMASLVAAGAGARVVKHGGRAASSASGTADVLEELGVRLDHPPERVAETAAQVGITFCFAQTFHPAMRHAAQARRELGVPTAFNLLGPMTNPAQPHASAIGVPDVRLARLIAGVMARRGRRALVFRGHEGLDELAPTGPARLWWVDEGTVTELDLDPVTDLGLAPVTLEDLRGGDAAANAAVLRAVVDGRGGAVRETVLLNAAAGLAVHGPGGAQSLTERLRSSLEVAAAAVDAGHARDVLDRWVAASSD
ncbi:anthranilate phosphoribosyltransferase [Cellulomonas bogoriensis]|uniref:Anthranilate phosphoribosyltransferase n=1 Tax=Cellulomonas bogoriensis 69B4 = DSM 16987 TaxID=1386082 RepID=A0A0A0BZ20_9CELL|nr:anthranilate phosphoribosyltransferase [Cellulomonas bogoriensis]KGM12947.1 anthranilate phosphoribosyltransferase [Cellulomonas bogoriensis 69B4 = DSM 16987]